MPCEILIGVARLVFFPLALSVFAILIAKSVLFESIRTRADAMHPKLGFLSRCPHCIYGWSALILMAFYPPLFIVVLAKIDTAVPMLYYPFLVVSIFIGWGILWGLSAFIYKAIWPFLEKHAPKMRINWSRYR